MVKLISRVVKQKLRVVMEFEGGEGEIQGVEGKIEGGIGKIEGNEGIRGWKR